MALQESTPKSERYLDLVKYFCSRHLDVFSFSVNVSIIGLHFLSRPWVRLSRFFSGPKLQLFLLAVASHVTKAEKTSLASLELLLGIF